MVTAPPEVADLQRLLAATAERDRKAFNRLYSAVSAKLFGVILRILRDRALAEDVLQETFLKIWRGASAYDAVAGRPVTWMATIARNTAIDAIRRRREVTLGTDEEGENWMDRLADPRSEGLDGADRMALSQCLGGLEAGHRDCIVLAYCEGFSREELAERFGRPVGTIKTWLFRGLAALKICLEGGSDARG